MYIILMRQDNGKIFQVSYSSLKEAEKAYILACENWDIVKMCHVLKGSRYGVERFCS